MLSAILQRIRIVAVLCLSTAAFFLGSIAAAQSYLTQVGNTTFSTTIPVELGHYDASTGDLHLQIALGMWPQRGGRTLTASLVYDSRIWYISGSSWQPGNIPGSQGGWRFETALGGTATHNTTGYNCTGGTGRLNSYVTYHNFKWTDTSGAIHSFPIFTETDPYNCAPDGNIPSDTEYADDASGFQMQVTNYTNTVVYAPDGSQVYPSFKDTNGNYYSTDSNGNLIDTLGRTPVTVTHNCNGNSSETCYDVLNSQGGTSRYTVVSTSVSVSTAFHQSGITEYSGSLPVISTITLPDNKYYSFTYDYTTYGELTSVTLPTGGLITYTYTTFFDAFNNANRWLYTHTSGGGQWTYAPSLNSICVSGYSFCQGVSVTKPDGNGISYNFDSNSGSNGSWLGLIIYYTGTQEVATINATWTSTSTHVQKQSVTSEFLDAPSPYPVKTTQYTYLSSSLPFLSQISEWNYFPLNNQPSTPNRVTTFSLYCHSLPGSITVTNGTTTIAQTNTTFDSYGSGLISATGITHHDDTNFGTGYTARCNPTSISKLVSGSTYLTTSMTYDTTGQVRSVTDPKGNATTLDYSDNFYNDNGNNSAPVAYTPPAPTNAYLKTATLPLIGAQSFGYYYGTGQMALTTDQNSAITTYHDYDLFSRPTATILSDGGWNEIAYASSETEADSYLGITSATPSTSCSSGCRHDELVTDSLRRPTYSYLVSDPDGETTVVTSYDSTGRVSSVTNPYRSASNGQDSYAYDGIDRVTQITHTDGTAINIFYGYKISSNGGIGTQLCSSSTYGLGYPTLTIDEAGRKRERWTDGFGRTIEVDEPDSSNNLTKNTCYAYDLNNNPSTVVSATGQTRTYTYDDLSRLTSVATPETLLNSIQHSTTYSYTNNGSLCSGNPDSVCVRTDPRGVTATYLYDALNRITSVAYSDGTSTVTYCYDGNNSPCISGGYSSTYGKTRRTAMSDGSGSTGWSYNPTGRIVAEKRTIAGVTKTISYSYNLDGSIASITYPTGRGVFYNVGGAERPLSVTDSNGTQYAVSASYSPSGALLSAIYGQVSGGFGGTTESRSYNNRLELTSIQASSSNGSAVNLAPCFTAFTISSGTPCSTSSIGNNGSVTGITNSVDSSETQAFAYDNLNRISSGVTKATSGNDCWGYTFGIDVVANLTSQTLTQCSGGTLNVTTDGYNHLVASGYSYDNAGNMTNDGSHTYTYDAEDRISSAANVNYIYDGDGLRVEKSGVRLYWRSPWGNTLTETATGGGSPVDYVFFAGRRLARISGSTVNYFYSDALGTIHTITDATGHPCYDASFTPYGQEVLNPNISQTCSSQYKFTGYEKDNETGNYYAFARYYNPRLDRFLSPDPVGGETADPQSGNGYAYVLNTPCNLVDAFGLVPSCNFRVSITSPDNAVTDPTGLTDAMKSVEAEIQDIFANSSLNQPVSVGVTFTSSGNADFSLTFSNAGVPGSGVAGEAPLGGTSADVYVNMLQYGLLWQGRVLGVTAAHELGHLAGFNDLSYSKYGPNIMTLDSNPANKTWDSSNPLQSNYSKGILFSPKQLQALFNECKSRRRRTGTGGGNGGGYFLEPITSCGYEEVEGGPEQWDCKVVGYRYVFY